MSGYIRVNYIPQRPGIHELSVIMGNEHVSESPYLITVDKKVENVRGQLSFGTPTVINVSRIRKEGRRYNVLLRVVDFVTEKMLLTEDGKLKKLSSQNMVTANRISRQMAAFPSFDGINTSSSPYSTGERNEPRVEKRNISDIDRNKRDNSSLRMSPPNSDTKVSSQRQKLKGLDLDCFTDRLQKVVSLSKFLVKQNLSHSSFQILHSAEQFLDGRPVRLTDTTFNLIECALKSIIPETGEVHTDESANSKISESDVLKIERDLGSAGLTDKCQQMLRACECITSPPRRITENASHTATEMIHFSKLMCVEPNLSRVQHRGKTIDMWLDNKFEVGDNCSYDLNCMDSPTICYNVGHNLRRKVYDADGPNEVTEVNGTKVKHNISSSCGEQCANLRDEGLNVGTPSREISAYPVSSIIRYENLKLETMSTVKFPRQQTRKEQAVLIPETAHMKVTDHKLQVDRVNCLIFMPQHLWASHKYTIKSVSEGKCLVENENRTNATVYESPEVLTLTEHEVLLAPVCSRGATFMSPKKCMEVISLLSSSFLQQLDNYQGNKNEISVRLTQVLQTKNANETVNYWICLTTAFSSDTGIEYKDIECTSKISVCARKNFESIDICSARDKYLQSVKHPTGMISICEHSELKTLDEASDKDCRARKHDESCSDSKWPSKNDYIKVTDIFINEDNPSDAETNPMNSQARQKIGTELVYMSCNINISVMETEEAGTVSGSHVWQKPAGDLANTQCISRRTNNTNICTLLSQTLQEPRNDSLLQLGTACEQTRATCNSLLAGVTFDHTGRVKHTSACISCNTSDMFPYLEDTPSHNSIAYEIFSSDDEPDQLFNLWSSVTRIESSPGVTERLHEDNALDLESVLTAPNLQEALNLLDQMLREIKERNTSGNVYKLSDVSVSTGQATVSPSTKSCGTEGSTNTDDNNIQF
jgi:hypothetical protein